MIRSLQENVLDSNRKEFQEKNIGKRGLQTNNTNS